MHKVLLAILLLGGIVFFGWRAWSPAGTGYGAGFADRDLDRAARRADDEGRLLVIDATATWCGPCRKMDRDTWNHPDVAWWFEEFGVFVKFDVDESPHLVEMFRVNAMPTVIAIRGDEEVARHVGYLGPRQMIDWLESVR